MARHYPNRSRRRPGHRPPHARRGEAHGVARPRGFGVAGMRQLYGAILPMRGEDRRRFFNEASSGLVVGLGLGGATIGLILEGPGGALLGFLGGVVGGGLFVEHQRYDRR
jgi:hypothetical protein